ncbi:MAG: flagellin [bacterium]
MSIYGKLGVINTNLMANAAYRGLESTNSMLSVHQNRIATLKKVNSSADDPAGYIHATGMKIDMDGMEMASNNIGNAQNMINITNDGASSIKNLLMEMRQKALEASDGSKNSAQRAAIQDQISQYINEIQDTVDQTTWNGELLLDGNASFNFQTGPDVGDSTNLAIGLNFRLGLRQANMANGLRGGDVIFSNTTAVTDGGKPTVTNADSVIDADWTIEFTGDNSYKVSYTTADGVSFDYESTFYLTEGQQYSGRGISLSGLRLASGIADKKFAEGDIITFNTKATVDADLYGLSWDVEDRDNYGMSLTSMIVADGDTGTGGLAEAGDLIEYEIKVFDGGTMNSGTTSAALKIRTRVDKGDGNGWGDWTDWEDEKTINASGTITFDGTNHHATDLEISFSGGDVLTEGDVFKGKIQTSQAGHVVDDSVNVDGLTGAGGLNLSTVNGAKSSLRKLDAALAQVDSELGNIGAMTKRLDMKSNLLDGRKTQTAAAVSRIEDADLINEQMNVSKLMILQQANMSLLAQAQQSPRMVLGILGLGG